MTIQVKLFWHWAEDGTQDSVNTQVKGLEKEMNEFLKTLRDDQVKKIYVAMNPSQRMGLVEYVVENN